MYTYFHIGTYACRSSVDEKVCLRGEILAWLIDYSWSSINRLTESNTARWKQKACIKIFPQERIVLFSMQGFCDDFCLIHFYLYFPAGSHEPSRFTFFHRYYLSSEKSTKKSLLMLRRSGNTTNGIHNHSPRVDWLIDSDKNCIFEIFCPEGVTAFTTIVRGLIDWLIKTTIGFWDFLSRRSHIFSFFYHFLERKWHYDF